MHRRTIAKGAAWSVPVVALTAPAAVAGVSLCQVHGSIQVGPKVTTNVRAICTAQSQWLHPGTIFQNYATGQLPQYLEICNCQNKDAWYRWREVDDVSEFQIEVDGVHVDQNSSAAGWRNSFFLPGFGESGGCKRFALTYRTSVARSTSSINVPIDFTLQTGPSANGPWTTLATIHVDGTLTRNSGQGQQNVNFSSCSAGGSQNRAVTARSAGGKGD